VGKSPQALLLKGPVTVKTECARAGKGTGFGVNLHTLRRDFGERRERSVQRRRSAAVVGEIRTPKGDRRGAKNSGCREGIIGKGGASITGRKRDGRGREGGLPGEKSRS